MSSAVAVGRDSPPAREHAGEPRPLGRPDRTFAPRRWVRQHQARWEHWPVWRLAGTTRSSIGVELELLARDPDHPERPPRDARGLYRGLHELASAIRGQLEVPSDACVEIRPYAGGLVVTPGASLVFEVPLSLQILAASGTSQAGCGRAVAALEARLAALGLKRSR